MPTYKYHCEDCDVDFEELVPLASYQDPQTCPSCGEKSKRILGAFPGMVFRGDGWASKNNRIAGQMRAKNERLRGKERNFKGDGMVSSLAPNVDGEQTTSWTEAAKLAKSRGKNTSGYDSRARKEGKSP